jgi:hypothetical protein
MKFSNCSVLAGMLFSSIVSAHAASPVTELLEKLGKQADAERAMTHVRNLYERDRWFTFPKFEETAKYLQQAMSEIGLERVEVIHAPADGKTQVGFWTMPVAWDVKSARLEIVEPQVSVSERVLADYEQVPSALGMWSGPTPPGGIVTDVVALEQDTEDAIRKANLRGKLLLTSKKSDGIKHLLVKAGALGAINGWTENPSLKDDRQWINAWGDRGWAFNKDDGPLLSFSVTPRQAEFLRSLLKKQGRVRVRANVESRYYDGTYPYATGVIPGSSDRGEVLTLGHIAEQGAHDNATGVAAMLEAMRILRELIDSGTLPRPARTIRILAMGELYASMHYVAEHPDRIPDTLAAFCLDTPAAAYEHSGTEYTFHLNPHAAKSFVDAFTLQLAKEYFGSLKPRRPWHAAPFMPGTDTFLADPMIGIPTVWPYSGTGIHTHHNSADTPETVDLRSLRDLVIIDAAFLYFLASAEQPEAEWLMELALSRGIEQIDERATTLLHRVAVAASAEALRGVASDVDQQLQYAVDRESAAVASTRKIHSSVQTSPAIQQLADFGKQQRIRIERALERRAVQLGVAGRVDAAPARSETLGITVRRKRFGTIPLDDLDVDKREGQPSSAWDIIPTTALFWCDGKRDLAEVIRLTRNELGPVDFDFVRYFNFLEKHGYVEFVK